MLAYWIKMPIVQFRPWSALRQAVTDGWWSEIALVESALPTDRNGKSKII